MLSSSRTWWWARPGKACKSFGRSYFLWLLGVVGAILAMVSGAAIVSFRYLSLLREAGHP